MSAIISSIFYILLSQTTPPVNNPSEPDVNEFNDTVQQSDSPQTFQDPFEKPQQIDPPPAPTVQQQPAPALPPAPAAPQPAQPTPVAPSPDVPTALPAPNDDIAPLGGNPLTPPILEEPTD